MHKLGRCPLQIAAALFALGSAGLGCKSTSGQAGGTGGASAATGGASAATGGASAASGGASGTGGKNGSPGGGTGGDGTGSCSNVAPCGGDVVGTWTVTSSCLTVTGKLDLVGFFGPDCTTAPVTGSLQVSGTWTAKADGTYTDNTKTTGHEQITLAQPCLKFSGTVLTCDQATGPVQSMGYSDVTCTSAPDGGCTCSATLDQSGSLGLVSNDPSTSGNFKVASNVITNDDTNPYAYCVAGSKMTWTPQPASPTTTGSIVFQVQAATGSGGASATGGASGSGGATGATGGSGTGASTGTGGAVATGGSPGQGGAGGAGGTSDHGGTTGAGGAPPPPQGPCDIYAASGTPCAAAYSTVRVLSSKYSGPLYQIRVGGSSSGTGGTVKDIGPIAGGVFADGPAQDTLCGSSACTISKLYDQSGKGNDLSVAGAGCYVTTADTESNAKARSLMVSGHKVYALEMVSNSSFGSSTGPIHDGYRNNNAKGLSMGTDGQGEYEVVDGKRANAGCCWDVGSAQRDSCSTGGTGAMDTISFGDKFVWGYGAGNGPWFMADFEGGVWAGGSGMSTTQNTSNPSVTWDYAFGLVKTDTSASGPQYAIRVGKANQLVEGNERLRRLHGVPHDRLHERRTGPAPTM